ncbi:MAG: hypothetical protein NTU53_08190 [Planctomycetota bacterium]|nr:hypothetical protein [Planctomycetota bacterium]
MKSSSKSRRRRAVFLTNAQTLPLPKYAGPVNEAIRCLIRVASREVYTVPSGGSFMTPISGPPQIVQGRIKYLDERQMVVQAGAPVIVELPKADSAYDLACGPLAVGRLVNTQVVPGATFEAVPLSQDQ